MTKFTCPDDPSHHIRLEKHYDDERSAYCATCDKRYFFCTFEGCNKLKDHEEKHPT